MTREAAGAARPARQLRAAIAARLERGDSLDKVERELIARSRLSEEQQSALWLYGWSLAEAGAPPRVTHLESRARETGQSPSAPGDYSPGD